HITLAVPVVHVWYFKGAPSKLSLVLDLGPKALENVIYFASYLVLDVDEAKRDKALATLKETMEERQKTLVADFEKKVAVEEEGRDQKIEDQKSKIKDKDQLGLTISEIEVSAKQKIAKIESDFALEKQRLTDIYRALLDLVKSVRTTSELTEEEYLKLDQYGSADFIEVGMGAEAILSVLKKLELEKLAAELREELSTATGTKKIKATKRLRIVDGMRRSGIRPEWMIMSILPVIPPDLRPMVQLSGGRFATSDLNDLYRRVINRNSRLKHLIDLGAPEIILRNEKRVFDILEEITKNHPVLLNRAPTLHKLGIQAFYPVLIEGSAIQVHPLVCTGYNADFDGDQMAVHVPLSAASKSEAANLMMAENNLLKPSDGMPVAFPNKEMILGLYYYTSIDNKIEASTTVFADFNEAITAYQEKKIELRQKITVWYKKAMFETTVGRILVNEFVPEPMGYINDAISISKLKSTLNKAMDIVSKPELVKLLDNLKNIGFNGSMLSGISVGIFDLVIIPNKDEMVAAGEAEAVEVEENYKAGLITAEEMHRIQIDIWIRVTDKITDLTWDAYEKDNSVRTILESGAGKSSRDNVKQVSGMRGLMVDPTGKIVALPTKSNFREGLSVFEYVTGTRGSRKGLSDIAIRTADAGYLTRRLVDVSHDMIIRKEDCGTTEGILISRNDNRTANFSSRILGRTAAEDIKSGKKVIVSAGDEIKESAVSEIEKEKIESVVIRSPLTCKAKFGLCQKCYGRDFSTRQLVELGVPSGVIAAQSIGEPGTQLTLKSKHTGGTVAQDVTQGLPRVEEVFETRSPKVLSPIAEIAGKVEVTETTDGVKVRIRSHGVKPVEEREYVIPLTSQLKVADGDLVAAGTQLSSGYLDIKDVLAARGVMGAQRYLIDELQAVYESQGIPINDKHFEVIVRKMSDKVRIETPGDTVFLPGEFTEKVRFEDENARVIAAGGEPASAQVTMLGVSRAALYTSSWLSAASFERTTEVLSESALHAAEDYLTGLKENVIIGRLIPTSADRARMD
ncbi:DNA-directed RNA polymerase subunit beta', partial [Candidatus Microgenomates bacterium]|nr:DNA-directed RNA polymerase subunit beta' [Candidatus Microgenomates bacterium]